MRTALREVRSRFGQKYPLVINGEKITTDKWMTSVNPSQPNEIVGAVADGGIPRAERAVKAARARRSSIGRRTSASSIARNCWSASPTIMDRRRFELSALEVYEVGKPWAEADGDIREAIDFLLFYAQQMRILGRPQLTQHVPGEESYQHYWPRGVALVIAPWNFPIAILMRDGFGRARHRQHRDHETGRAIGGLRRAADGDVRGSRRARRAS